MCSFPFISSSAHLSLSNQHDKPNLFSSLFKQVCFHAFVFEPAYLRTDLVLDPFLTPCQPLTYLGFVTYILVSDYCYLPDLWHQPIPLLLQDKGLEFIFRGIGIKVALNSCVTGASDIKSKKTLEEREAVEKNNINQWEKLLVLINS